MEKQNIQVQSNTASHVSTLVQITRELTGLVNKETAQLQQRRPSDTLEFQERKLNLSAAYDREIKIIGQNGGLKATGSGEIVRHLKKETRIFQTALKRHGQLVKALKTVSENMIQAIGDEVGRQQASSRNYGADAKISNYKSAGATTTLALNKTV